MFRSFLLPVLPDDGITFIIIIPLRFNLHGFFSFLRHGVLVNTTTYLTQDAIQFNVQHHKGWVLIYLFHCRIFKLIILLYNYFLSIDNIDALDRLRHPLTRKIEYLRIIHY